MRTDYCGSWKANIDGHEVVLTMKMEYYEIEGYNADTVLAFKAKGSIWKDFDTLTFVQDMRYDHSLGFWVYEPAGRAKAIYNVNSDLLRLEYLNGTVHEYTRLK